MDKSNFNLAKQVGICLRKQKKIRLLNPISLKNFVKFFPNFWKLLIFRHFGTLFSENFSGDCCAVPVKQKLGDSASGVELHKQYTKAKNVDFEFEKKIPI